MHKNFLIILFTALLVLKFTSDTVNSDSIKEFKPMKYKNCSKSFH